MLLDAHDFAVLILLALFVDLLEHVSIDGHGESRLLIAFKRKRIHIVLVFFVFILLLFFFIDTFTHVIFFIFFFGRVICPVLLLKLEGHDVDFVQGGFVFSYEI